MCARCPYFAFDTRKIFYNHHQSFLKMCHHVKERRNTMDLNGVSVGYSLQEK